MIRTTAGRAGASILRRIRARGGAGSCSDSRDQGRQRWFRRQRILTSSSTWSALSVPVAANPCDNRNGIRTVTTGNSTVHVVAGASSLPASSSPKLHQLTPHRSLGLHRRPHQRNLRDTSGEQTYDDANPTSSSEFKTADDMETYDFLSDDFHPLEDDDAFRRAQSGVNNDGFHDDGDDADEEERIRMDLEKERKAQAVRDELDRRTGRLWTDDWEITEDDWFAGKKFDDLPDWSPEMCSRVSLERVKVLEGRFDSASSSDMERIWSGSTRYTR